MIKVIIIEDDSIVANIYKNRLEKEGYQVEVAPDGQSGFYRIHEFRPDAVLLDLMLPKMNGVEILKKIRAEKDFNKTPIIVFTNAYVPNMIKDALQAGATQVFNKATLTPRQIIDALHTAVSFSGGPATRQAAPPTGSATEDGEPSGEAPFHATTGTSDPQPESALSQQPHATATDSDEVDSDFQSELLRSFMASVPAATNQIRRSLQGLIKAPDEPTRLANLLDLYRKVHSLTSNAGIAGLHNVAQIAAALEVLLKELHEKPKNINASTLRTVAHSVDFVNELFNRGPEGERLDTQSINILVADDEILSRRAITYALDKAGLKSVTVEEAQAALKLAAENTFDLVFLDVQMPGMDGFELCSKLRTLPQNKGVPVIFVTSLTDFTSRARSTLSGGTDFIAKPFMFIELSVKALTYALRGRFTKPSEQQAA